MKKTISFLALLSFFSNLFVASPPAQAADASQFNPGLIISDSVFFAGNSMSAGSIQSFLESKVQSCRAGYTCLKDYTQATPNMAAREGRCAQYAGSARERASDIIAKVGVACGISPKVLIVLLQKEQGLITDDWPVPSQYQHATGFACPDTAPCDPNYAGFFNQVYSAAYQFKNYGLFNSYFNYHPGQVNRILYNPNQNCGSSEVYIHNQATANLYIYTPYQPNAAALSNLYGYGDSCSAYGNRNFWRIFTDWFGATVEGFEYSITSLYLANGGVNGTLGLPTTGFIPISASGGGWVQGYSNGAITHKPNVATVVISGQMRSQYNNKYGGIAGRLGWPVTMINRITTSGGADVQGFENGALVISQGSNEGFVLSGALRAAYASFGSAVSLGWPTSDAICSVNNECWQSFTLGNLYTNGSSSIKISNPMLTKYLALGGPQSPLGWPTSNLLTSTASGGGLIQVFSTGVIVKANNTNPVTLSGKIREFFNSLGGLSGVVGWPTQEPVCTSNGCSQVFQNAVISCPTTGNCVSNTQPTPTPTPVPEVTGPQAIDAEYLRSGGQTVLGSPLTGYNSISIGGGGIVRGYERGAIAWSRTNGAYVLTGGLRTAFNSLGGFTQLGWPTANQICNSQSSCSQAFTNATITWSQQFGGFIVGSSFIQTFQQTGGITGVLGAASTRVIPITSNGGGTVQAFAGGAVTRKNGASNSYLIRGGIRQFYSTVGGLSGTLGWPISNENCPDQNTCTQTFERGVIDWTLTTGGRIR